MAWLRNANWSQLKDQITTITKDILTEPDIESLDPAKDLALTRSRLSSVEGHNAALIAEVDRVNQENAELLTRLETAQLKSTADHERLASLEEELHRLSAFLPTINGEEPAILDDMSVYRTVGTKSHGHNNHHHHHETSFDLSHPALAEGIHDLVEVTGDIPLRIQYCDKDCQVEIESEFRNGSSSPVAVAIPSKPTTAEFCAQTQIRPESCDASTSYVSNRVIHEIGIQTVFKALADVSIEAKIQTIECSTMCENGFTEKESHDDSNALRKELAQLREQLDHFVNGIVTASDMASISNVLGRNSASMTGALWSSLSQIKSAVITDERECQTEPMAATVDEQQHQQQISYLSSQVAVLQAEKDHYINAAHKQHDEAVRLFGDCEKYMADIARLRDHLVKMEGDYTAAALEAEKREKQLNERLAISSKSAGELDHLVKEKGILTEKLATAEAMVKKLNHQTLGLQAALDDLQNNAERQFATERDRMRRQVSQMKTELEESRTKLAQAATNDQLLENLRQQLDKQKVETKAAKDAALRTQESLQKATASVAELKLAIEGRVEVSLVKGLITACLQTSGDAKRQSEAVRLSAKILGFSDSEIKQVETSTVSSGSRSKTSTNSPAIPANGSLSEMFIRFLETESGANSAIGAGVKAGATPVRLSFASSTPVPPPPSSTNSNVGSPSPATPAALSQFRFPQTNDSNSST